MKPRVVLTLLYFVAAALPGRADDTLTTKALERLKAATVYVKVESGDYAATGSGFVFHVQENVAYLATNEHVVMVPAMEIPRPFGMITGLGLFGSFPAMPGRGFPRPPMRLPPLRLPPRVGKVTVIFGSGTRTERALPATVVFRDSKHDLALLKVVRHKDLPEPIAIPKDVKLTETMPIYVLGYPFGEELDPHGENPAITVGKGAISSLREDVKGDLTRIQIEAEVHPGNSGGPVVDAAGRLLGVAVAKIRDTRIGLVIPAAHLSDLMRGRFVEVGFYPKRLEPGTGVVLVNLLLFDPLQQIQSAQLHWLPPDIAAAKPSVGKGGLAAVKGSQSLMLEPGRTTWQGHVRLATPEQGQAALPFQIVLARKESGPQITPVFTYRWLANPKAPERKPLAEGELARLAADLTIPAENYQPRRAAMARLVAAEPGEPRKEVIELIRKQLDDPDQFLRESSARALTMWAGLDGRADLLKRLQKEDFPWVRWTLLEELGKLPGDESSRAIVHSLARDRSSGFPAKALRTLGPTAEKHVLPLLQQPDAALRLEACRILEKIGTKQSRAALETINTRESDPLLREAAGAALKTIKDRK